MTTESVSSQAKDGRREDILRAALESFHTEGYSQTSVRALAEATGLSVAGLYYHFKTKEQILFTIIDGLRDQLLADIRTARDAWKTPEERLVAMLTATVRLVLARRAEIRVQLDNLDRLAPELQEIVQEKARESTKIVRAELESLQQADKLGDFDVNLVTYTLFGMTNWVYYWYDPQGPLSAEKLIDQLVRMLLHGIMKD